MAPTPDGMSVTPENAQEVGQRDELKNYTKEELMMLAEAKGEAKDETKDETSDPKESKETFVKSLEFEPDTFKIDSTDWIEPTQEDAEENRHLKKFINTWTRVKVNPTGDVLEYLDGPAEGEQLFIGYYAIIREVMKAKNCTKEEVESKYLMTVNEFKQKMADKPYQSAEYDRFFEQECNGHLAGTFDPITKKDYGINKRFYGIGEWSAIWLVHGAAAFTEHGWSRGDDITHGNSARLLKN